MSVLTLFLFTGNINILSSNLLESLREQQDGTFIDFYSGKNLLRKK